MSSGAESDKICNDGACVCEVNNMLKNMSMDDTDVVVLCANCGKEGDDINNICNKCKQVKYCNAACKKKHKHKHKKDCEDHIRLAAEHAAKLHDEQLFKQPPPAEQGDCPICFLRLPSFELGRRYYACCGKIVCSGCDYAPIYDNQGNKVKSLCPFCRTPKPKSNEEAIEREKKRVEVGDTNALYNLGSLYTAGKYGLTQDYDKGLELLHRAADLGHAGAYTNIGYAYDHGEGLEIDKEKAMDYYELAAMRGNVQARNNLGSMEACAGNWDRALKHYMIAIRGGDDSLEMVKQMYSKGQVIKEDCTKALQAYQEYLGEIKSSQRDEAAAARNDCRYY